MYDVIIVGAGSAGCVLANRLSADSSRKVLLMEAGPSGASRWIRMPAGLIKTFTDPSVTWCDYTESEVGLNGRKIYLPHGRVLGGSSSINGMAYVRGQRHDYDGWRDQGNPGWGYDDVLPLFRRSEHWEGKEDQYRSKRGELGVSLPDVRYPASVAFIEAGKELGLTELFDYNERDQEGIGWEQYTIWNGRRSSTEAAFIDSIRDRKNLTILTGTLVTRIIFSNKRAIGIEVRIGDQYQKILGSKIVLSAGAIGSPQLLMLSGVGPSGQLEACGIKVVTGLNGVGMNLHDQFYTHVRVQVKGKYSLNTATRFPGYIPHAVEYLVKRSGLLAMAPAHCIGFVRSSADSVWPDMQLVFRPYAFIIQGSKIVSEQNPTVTFSACFVNPRSRGSLKLNQKDPSGRPLITMNYLSNSEDVKATVAGVRWLRRFINTKAFSAIKGPSGEIDPGANMESDSEIESWCRANGQSIYHPVGTCKMGNDGEAVVDAGLRVYGTENLWVCDASIMPAITSGNTNAPTIMIGEKGAELIGSAN